MLRDLLRIKKIREDRARSEVTRARFRVDAAVVEVEKRKVELTEYINWRVAEEKTLYDDVMGSHVHQHDLDFLKLRIASIREHDGVLEEAIQTAEEKVKEAEDALKEARLNYDTALKAVKKFEEFVSVEDEKEAKIKEKLEELELEEFNPKFRDQ